MLYNYLLLLSLASLSLALAPAEMSVQAPALKQCETATIEWAGGTPPYDVYLYDRGSAKGADQYFEHIGPVDNTSIQWLADLPAGSRIGVNVRDADHPNFDGSALATPALIKESDDDSCLADGPKEDDTQPLIGSEPGPGCGSAVASSATSTGAASTTSDAAPAPSESDSGNGSLSKLTSPTLWPLLLVIGVLAV